MTVLEARTIDQGQSPWVVWIHGFLGSSVDFLPHASRLAGDFRSLLVDLPGHGGSIAVRPRSVEDAAELVARTIAARGIDRAHLVGYSLGGRVALRVAAAHQPIVKTLVVESASPGIVGSAARAVRVESDRVRSERLTEEGRSAFLDSWYRQTVFKSLARDEARRSGLAESRNVVDETTTALALVAFSPGTQVPLWRKLPAIRLPVLYVAGELDEKYVAVGRRVVSLMPTASLAVVPDAGHVVHFEAPDAYFDTVARFLHKHQ